MDSDRIIPDVYDEGLYEFPRFAWIVDQYGVELFVNVRISEAHTLESELAEQVLETGARVSDHLVQKPRVVSLVYEQTNSRGDADTQSTEGNRYANPQTDAREDAQAAWEALRNMWRRRSLVTVVTQHEQYSDMVIESVSAMHRAPNKHALQFTASLKQVNFAGIGRVDVPASALAGSVSKQGVSQVNAGTKLPKTPEADSPTTLFNAMNAVLP